MGMRRVGDGEEMDGDWAARAVVRGLTWLRRGVLFGYVV
jgi:hypothetical protein